MFRESFVSFVNNRILEVYWLAQFRKLRAIHLHSGIHADGSLRVAEVIKVITGVFLTDPWLSTRASFLGGDVEVGDRSWDILG